MGMYTDILSLNLASTLIMYFWLLTCGVCLHSILTLLKVTWLPHLHNPFLELLLYFKTLLLTIQLCLFYLLMEYRGFSYGWVYFIVELNFSYLFMLFSFVTIFIHKTVRRWGHGLG